MTGLPAWSKGVKRRTQQDYLVKVKLFFQTKELRLLFIFTPEKTEKQINEWVNISTVKQLNGKTKENSNGFRSGKEGRKGQKENKAEEETMIVKRNKKNLEEVWEGVECWGRDKFIGK